MARRMVASSRRYCRTSTLSERWETPYSDKRVTAKRSGSSVVMNRLTPAREQRWISEYMYSRKRISSPLANSTSVRLSIRTRLAPHPIDAVKQFVDPLVDVQVDRRAVHHRDPVVERPAERFCDAWSWVGFSWRLAMIPCSPAISAGDDEVQSHERLSDARRPCAQR